MKLLNVVGRYELLMMICLGDSFGMNIGDVYSETWKVRVTYSSFVTLVEL